MNDFLSLMKNHRTIRHFKDYPIGDDTLQTLIEAGQCAASSNFAQAYTIIRVKDLEKRRIMAELSGNQAHVLEAPLFLVFVADLERARLAASLNGERMMEGQTEAFILATVDTALVAQNVMLAAESMGLGGVYVGALRNEPQVVSELLELPLNTYPLFGMCLGYPAVENERKPRLPLDLVLKTDSYAIQNEVDLLKEYDRTMEEYYKGRNTGNRTDTWTRQMARMFSKALRPHMKEFLEKRNLNFR